METRVDAMEQEMNSVKVDVAEMKERMTNLDANVIAMKEFMAEMCDSLMNRESHRKAPMEQSATNETASAEVR